MDSFAAARAATEPQEEACDDEDQAPAGAIGMLGPLAFSEPLPPLTGNDEREPTPDGDEEPWHVVEDLPFALFHHVDLTQEGESMPQQLQLHRPCPNLPLSILFPLLESESEEQTIVVDEQMMRPLRRVHERGIDSMGLLQREGTAGALAGIDSRDGDDGAHLRLGLHGQECCLP